MLYTFGDSISAGYGASKTSNSFPYLIAKATGESLINSAIHGSMVPDQAKFIYGSEFSTGDTSTLMIGTNDERIYREDDVKRGLFISGLSALAVFISGRPKKAVSNGDYSGQWENTYAYGIGKSSFTKGSKCSFSVIGTAVFIGFIRQVACRGQFTVTIDGVFIGTYSTNGDGLTTAAGVSYGPALFSLTGLSDGTHHVVLEVVSDTSPSNRVYIDWWAGSEPGTQLKVANVPYALSYGSGGSSLNVDLYNQYISKVVNELSACGLSIELVDINSSLLPTDMFDDYHPNDSGHRKMFSRFLPGIDIINYSPAQVFIGSDGKIYIGEDKKPLSEFSM